MKKRNTVAIMIRRVIFSDMINLFFWKKDDGGLVWVDTLILFSGMNVKRRLPMKKRVILILMCIIVRLISMMNPIMMIHSPAILALRSGWDSHDNEGTSVLCLFVFFVSFPFDFGMINPSLWHWGHKMVVGSSNVLSKVIICSQYGHWYVFDLSFIIFFCWVDDLFLPGWRTNFMFTVFILLSLYYQAISFGVITLKQHAIVSL